MVLSQKERIHDYYTERNIYSSQQGHIISGHQLDYSRSRENCFDRQQRFWKVYSFKSYSRSVTA